MVKAISVDGLVKLPQELSTVAGDEGNSCDFAFLECLLAIESPNYEFGVSSQDFTLPQLCPCRPGPQLIELVMNFRAGMIRRIHQSLIKTSKRVADSAE